MKFTTPKEKSEVSKAFKALLLEHDHNLTSFCKAFPQFPYARTNERLTRNSITDTDLNEMIHILDKNKFVQSVNGKWVIGRKIA
jgi:hypothetical protein